MDNQRRSLYDYLISSEASALIGAGLKIQDALVSIALSALVAGFIISLIFKLIAGTKTLVLSDKESKSK